MTAMHGDRALPEEGVDQLGFGPTADRIAEALSGGIAADGLVVGVVGKWGSGKSSLLNLTRAAIHRRDMLTRPHVVEFKPWLVGDRDALLRTLFSELVAGIDAIELEGGDATGVGLRQTERAADALRELLSKLEGVGKVIKAASPWLPWLEPLGHFIGSLGAAAQKGERSSITATKHKVVERLRGLKRSLVVLIDDVDRLDPGEIIEVLRLVRSVADFPNVVYVLCYDSEIVAHAVKVAAKARNGHAYIEKIVQITVPVPAPEAFELRRWFERELRTSLPPMSYDEERRITDIIDREGGRYLLTPRAVVRSLDSIRFYWAASHGQIDFSDFVWLHFVKVGNPALYEWVAVYLSEMSARASGRAHIPAEQVVRFRTELDRALTREGATFAGLCDRLSGFLPGVLPFNRDDAEPGIFRDVPDIEANRSARDRRLSSPDHYRLYLAFASPTNSPTGNDYDRLREALSVSVDQAVDLLRQWHGARLTSGVTKAEVVLNRIATRNVDLNTEQAERLLLAFADELDELANAANSFEQFGGPDVWRRAKSTLPILLGVVGERRNSIVRPMFQNGRALGWLSSVFRDETFAHGRYGDRPTSNRMLNTEELDTVTEVLIARYRQMSFEEFTRLPQPIGALYAWQQGGDHEGPRALIASAIQTDDGLVSTVEHLCGVIQLASGDSVERVITLSRSNLSDLLDYDSARSRIQRLSSSNGSSDIAERARVLTARFEAGDRF